MDNHEIQFRFRIEARVLSLLHYVQTGSVAYRPPNAMTTSMSTLTTQLHLDYLHSPIRLYGAMLN
jgi:hypothetical protein